VTKNQKALPPAIIYNPNNLNIMSIVSNHYRVCMIALLFWIDTCFNQIDACNNFINVGNNCPLRLHPLLIQLIHAIFYNSFEKARFWWKIHVPSTYPLLTWISFMSKMSLIISRYKQLLRDHDFNNLILH
jgi:hypothetical protein